MKNLLTDKTLKAFEEWMRPNPMEHGRFGQLVTNTFENLPDSMQYGVIVDFFDSVDIEVYIYRVDKGILRFKINTFNYYHKGGRPQARKAAVEKANNLFNQIN